ncbi:conserved hypothetical protein [Nostocoides japonicum T1-X7]|uniref:EcsC family protein n=1 Tax=Nostocoides japonicum T1-X7 TaxID=1194083 RepID=A0A077LUP4_9MICO|nr:EcsC family protein [Tetrasphaera japonica]CCH76407.1 conserved hypothetical protein [Tetrasphaera japonica T1-X7]
MAPFGIGRTKEIERRPTVLDDAGRPADRGVVESSALRLAEGLLDVGITGKGPFHSAADIADKALARSGGDVEKAVRAVVRSHVAMGSASGFVTSVGGFTTLALAMPANIVGFYLVATRMTAAVARLRGYDVDNPQIRTAVLLTLVGADAEDLLVKAGLATAGGGVTNLAAQRLPGPVLMVVNKAVAFRILTKAGADTFKRFGKRIPLVGGAVGGGLDGWLLGRIADNARREFPASGRPGESAPLVAR